MYAAEKTIINLSKGEKLWIAQSDRWPGKMFKGRSPAEAWGKMLLFFASDLGLVSSCWGHDGARTVATSRPLGEVEGGEFLMELEGCGSKPKREVWNLRPHRN
jgi:hypothetical protein